jgi:membrane protease YdiL (CAAX protease family)
MLPRALVAPVHVLGYLLATAAWVLVLGIGTALRLSFAGGSLEDGGLVSILTVVQLVGMTGIALVGAWLLPGGEPLPRTLGLVRPAAVAVALAAPLGLVVGLFPSWVTEALSDWLPEPLVNQLIGEGLDGSVRSLVLTGVMVCVSAPICEELVFRGYLWAACERSGAPRWVAWVVTTLLFTLYHLDPAQMIGVLPIALVLGWARWRTGSVWPGMVVHFANNALALGSAAWAGDDDWTPPAWLALASLALTIGLCAALPRPLRREGDDGA